MGDRFQTLVAAAVPVPQAPALGIRAIDLLSTRGVIQHAPRPEGGYAPGARALWASEPGLVVAGPPRPLLFQLMDAPAVHSSDPDRFEPDWAACPGCAARVEALHEDWDPAARAWLRGDAETGLLCAACGTESPVEHWAYPGGYALAGLGLRFWNWPPLRAEFIGWIGSSLGHPLRCIRGGR